jgi:hypothetical protein
MLDISSFPNLPRRAFRGRARVHRWKRFSPAIGKHRATREERILNGSMTYHPGAIRFRIG